MSRRNQDYTCVICLDSLFQSRDDVDDAIPVVTTHCGHIFHTPCIKAALQASSERWLDVQLTFDPHARIDDARADCPSCREEIFMDPEGQLELIRIYPAEAEGSSSQAGSSPMRRGNDAPLMSLARRAKAIRELTDSLGANSRSGDVHRSIERAKQVVQEGASDRAFDSVKNHLQALSAAIQALSATLLSNPLIPDLQAAQAVLENTIQVERRAHRKLRDQEMPAAIRAAVNVEKEKYAQMLAAEKVEKQRITLERDRERATRKAAQTAWEQEQAGLKAQIQELQKALQKEVKDHGETVRQLRDRTATVKQLQMKADSRKSLKEKVAELENENASLHEQLAHSGSRATTAAVAAAASSVYSDDLNDGDDSLMIDYPSPSPKAAALHPTARVIPVDVKHGLGSSKRPRLDDREGVLQPTSKTNPFATTKAAGEKKKSLAIAVPPPPATKKAKTSIIDFVDLTGTSPDSPGSSLMGRASATSSKFFVPTSARKAPLALADQLGLKDSHGRPTKGVASGPRVSRR